MAHKDNKLYCIFVREDNIEEKIRQIQSIYNVCNNKILQFTGGHPDELILIYEVELKDKFQVSLPSSLVIHKNAKHKVYYSINALNLVTKQTGNYKVDWENYSKSLLTTLYGDLKQSNLILNKIYNLS